MLYHMTRDLSRVIVLFHSIATALYLNSINFRFPSISMDNFKENITLEEISTQNGPPKKINKIIVKIIK